VTWLLVPLAFAAMFMQDVLSVWLVRAEAQGRAHAAGNWDAAQDACRLLWLWIGGDALFVSRDLPFSLAVIAATLLADRWGTYAGVKLGARLEKRRGPQATVSVEFSGNRLPGDEQFAEWIKRYIRRNGGNAGVLR
jgi:hypothetical protein